MIKNKGKRLCGSPYVSEELLRQLLDMIHDFVRTGLLLSYPLHMIGRQLGGGQDGEATLTSNYQHGACRCGGQGTSQRHSERDAAQRAKTMNWLCHNHDFERQLCKSKGKPVFLGNSAG